jgi:hypothetical protein
LLPPAQPYRSATPLSVTDGRPSLSIATNDNINGGAGAAPVSSSSVPSHAWQPSQVEPSSSPLPSPGPISSQALPPIMEWPASSFGSQTDFAPTATASTTSGSDQKRNGSITPIVPTSTTTSHTVTIEPRRPRARPSTAPQQQQQQQQQGWMTHSPPTRIPRSSSSSAIQQRPYQHQQRPLRSTTPVIIRRAPSQPSQSGSIITPASVQLPSFQTNHDVWPEEEQQEQPQPQAAAQRPQASLNDEDSPFEEEEDKRHDEQYDENDDYNTAAASSINDDDDSVWNDPSRLSREGGGILANVRQFVNTTPWNSASSRVVSSLPSLSARLGIRVRERHGRTRTSTSTKNLSNDLESSQRKTIPRAPVKPGCRVYKIIADWPAHRAGVRLVRYPHFSSMNQMEQRLIWSDMIE